MIRLSKDGDCLSRICPDPVSFATVITGFARRSKPEEAEALLQMSIAFFRQSKDGDSVVETGSGGVLGVVDLTSSLNAATLAWTRSGRSEAAARAHMLLREGYRVTQLAGSSVCLYPDIQTYSLVMDAYSRSHDPDDLLKADQFLVDIVDQFRRHQTPLLNSAVFAQLINAWLRSKHADRALRADSILKLMLRLSEREHAPCSPDAGVFAMTMLCYARSKHPDAPKRIPQLLEMMEARTLINNLDVYAIAVNSLCHSGDREAVVEACDILTRMVRRKDSGKYEWPRNVEGLYTLILSTLAKQKVDDAPQLARLLLSTMPTELNPPIAMFTSLVTVLAMKKSNWREIVKVFQKLDEMDADDSSNVRFDQASFRCILQNLAKSNERDAAAAAAKVACRMLELHRSGRTNVEPDARCFDACIKALLKAGDPESISHATELSRRLNDLRMRGQLPQSPSKRSIGALRSNTMR
jgi:PPR repeat